MIIEIPQFINTHPKVLAKILFFPEQLSKLKGIASAKETQYQVFT